MAENAPEATQFVIAFRPAGESDAAYVVSSWLKAAGGSLVRRIGSERYLTIHRPLVAALLARSAVYVAHPGGDPDTILGTLAVEQTRVGPAVHWLYVRHAWRGNGIARGLLAYAGVTLDPQEPVLFTCWTSDTPLLVRRFRGIAHVPAMFLRQAEQEERWVPEVTR